MGSTDLCQQPRVSAHGVRPSGKIRAAVLLVCTVQPAEGRRQQRRPRQDVPHRPPPGSRHRASLSSGGCQDPAIWTRVGVLELVGLEASSAIVPSSPCSPERQALPSGPGVFVPREVCWDWHLSWALGKGSCVAAPLGADRGGGKKQEKVGVMVSEVSGAVGSGFARTP